MVWDRRGPVGWAQQIAGEPRAVAARCTSEALVVSLEDGRELHVPLTWFDRLMNATPKALKQVEVRDGGRLIHLPALDEGISVERLLSPPCPECLNRLWYAHGVAVGRGSRAAVVIGRKDEKGNER
jgi:hypothetical protein